MNPSNWPFKATRFKTMLIIKTINYTSGILAIILIPVFIAMYMLSKTNNNERVILLYAGVNCNSEAVDIICSVKSEFENIEMSANESELKLRKHIHEFVNKKNRENYLCILLNENLQYKKFIKILDICMNEKVPSYFYYNDKIWLSHRQYEEPEIIYIY
jgi:hypothetical protein